MEKEKDLSEMLNLVNKFNKLTVKNKNFDEKEELPKLRKPKEATLQKLRASQKKKKNVSAKDATDNTKDTNILNIPLRQEFLTKKQRIEKSTSDLLRKYEIHKLQHNMLEDMCDLTTEEAQPLTLNKKEFDLPFSELNKEINNSINEKSEDNKQSLNSEMNNSTNIKKTISKSSKNLYDVLTYPEHLIYTIIYSKVRGHPHGYFADNIPDWYKRTFDKDLVSNWLEICKKSQQFLIENIQNKIVLYIRKEEGDDILDIDLNAAGDNKKIVKTKSNNVENTGKESSDGFVRYEHLQKSLQEYTNGAGRKKFIKSNENIVKPNNKYIKNNNSLKK